MRTGTTTTERRAAAASFNPFVCLSIVTADRQDRTLGEKKNCSERAVNSTTYFMFRDVIKSDREKQKGKNEDLGPKHIGEENMAHSRTHILYYSKPAARSKEDWERPTRFHRNFLHFQKKKGKRNTGKREERRISTETNLGTPAKKWNKMLRLLFLLSFSFASKIIWPRRQKVERESSFIMTHTKRKRIWIY